MTPTIADIAHEASVSQSTVSNLLNGRVNRMRPETRERITRAMEKLDYRPSRVARQLRTGNASIVGLVVPSVANPFWGSWARVVEAEALQHGYQLFLCNSERDAAREREYIEQMWSRGLRSVILATSLPDLGHLRPVIDRGLQLIAFDREPQPDDPNGVVNVSIDNELGGYLAAKHCIDLGHRDIGFISGVIATISRRRRFAGYRRALKEAGIPFREELLWADAGDGYGDVDSTQLGTRGALTLLSLNHPPTALVTVNDMYAIGACAAIRSLGYNVPEVSVVGFDDIVLAPLYNPPLTTMRQPVQEMAKFAVGAILNHAEGDDTQSRQRVMAPELVVRDSTAPPNSWKKRNDHVPS